MRTRPSIVCGWSSRLLELGMRFEDFLIGVRTEQVFELHRAAKLALAAQVTNLERFQAALAVVGTAPTATPVEKFFFDLELVKVLISFVLISPELGEETAVGSLGPCEPVLGVFVPNKVTHFNLPVYKVPKVLFLIL
jgi:hypothetical protein